MSTGTIVLIVVLIILIAALVALYFFGKKTEKKQAEQKAQMVFHLLLSRTHRSICAERKSQLSKPKSDQRS